jgi:hypothetical protein
MSEKELISYRKKVERERRKTIRKKDNWKHCVLSMDTSLLTLVTFQRQGNLDCSPKSIEMCVCATCGFYVQYIPALLLRQQRVCHRHVWN